MLYLFNDEAVHVYEFTISRAKDKARGDALKIREIIDDLHRQPRNALKTFTGWFVTRDEPTADQRMAILDVVKNRNVIIHAISVAILQRRLCDSEAYLSARGNAPFGSIVYATNENIPSTKIDVSFSPRSGQEINIKELAAKLISGDRLLLV